MQEETTVIFVDVHAETTSEKIAVGRFLDGKVSAVAGTHTHVQTADEQIFPGGTAFICDAGMCGPTESILGREIEPIVQRFLTSMPVNFPVARGEVKLHGLLVDIDESNGRALAVSRVAEVYRPSPPETEATPTRSPNFLGQITCELPGMLSSVAPRLSRYALSVLGRNG